VPISPNFFGNIEPPLCKFFLATAKPQTANGCCGTILLDGVECVADGSFNNKDFYQCSDDANHVVIHLNFPDKWISVTSGRPIGFVFNVNYDGLIASSATCPLGWPRISLELTESAKIQTLFLPITKKSEKIVFNFEVSKYIFFIF
jgi:hypothetical protein